jgi:hypothetical protein
MNHEAPRPLVALGLIFVLRIIPKVKSISL